MKADIESPWLEQDSKLSGVLEELRSREPIFHRPEHGTSRTDFQNMIVDDFWEVGASGRRYGAKFVLDTLEQRQQNPEPDFWKTTDFHCRQLAENLFLLTYTLLQGENFERKTRRSTIWQRLGSDWKIVYHQGTIIEGD